MDSAQLQVLKENKRATVGSSLLDIYKRRTSLQKHLNELQMTKQGERFLHCGLDSVIFECLNENCEDFGTHTSKKFRCTLRICPYCAKKHSDKLKEKYKPIIKKCKKARSIYAYGLRFLTLTIKNQEDIGKGISLLYEGITRLRRRKYFSSKVKAGLGVIEMKVGFDNKWNIHAHFIIESSFLDMKSHKLNGKDAKLVREWSIASRDRGICDVRLLNDRKYKYSNIGALDYTLDYLSKGQAHLNDMEKAVFLRFSKSRRIIFSFGKFYNIKNKKYDLICDKCFNKLSYFAKIEFIIPSINTLDFYSLSVNPY